MWLDNSDFLGPFMRKLFLITEDSMHLMRREAAAAEAGATAAPQKDCPWHASASLHQPARRVPTSLTESLTAQQSMLGSMVAAHRVVSHKLEVGNWTPSCNVRQAGKAGRSKKDTAVARTRSQQAGKQSAKKEAEITESEPSGNEHDRSGGLLKPAAVNRLRRASLHAIMRSATVAMSVRVISAPSLKTRSLLRPDE
ncbi:hypothetical protein WJX77_004735 [Trebouxia sp. C0004]